MFIQLKRFQNDLRELIFDCLDTVKQLPFDDHVAQNCQLVYLINKLKEVNKMIDNAPDILLQKAGD